MNGEGQGWGGDFFFLSYESVKCPPSVEIQMYLSYQATASICGSNDSPDSSTSTAVAIAQKMESTQSLMMMKMRITMTLSSTIINNTKQQALREGSEQVADQTCLSSVWQSPCNSRGHWDSERRWVRICLADPKSAFTGPPPRTHASFKL